MTAATPNSYCRAYRVLEARAERGEQITAIDAITAFSADPETAAIASEIKAAGADDIDAAAFAKRFNIPESFVPILIGALIEVVSGNIRAVIGIRGAQPKAIH
jgi:hypothetical protein